MSNEQSRLAKPSNRLLLEISYLFIVLAAFLMLTDLFRLVRPAEPETDGTKSATVLRAANHRRMNYGLER